MPKTFVTSLLFTALIASAVGVHAAEHLRGEQSAFLKTFVESPVDWMPWGDAAIARAKKEQRPVFLFVGCFTSELAGAMRRQTFANQKTADWLNTYFVCVIVDRDERPDVAALYGAYVSTLKQLTGWPLNVWLTPDFQPFEGATYLSPSEDWGAPGFLKLANQAKAAWTANPAGCRKRAAESASQLATPASAAPPAWDLEKTRTRLSAASAAWNAVFDSVDGGYGDVPRWPEPELIRFMLLQPPADRDTALKTLRALATSAVRDPLDGGFFRHSADAAWRIPYQQKVLSDQSRIALAFLAGADGGDANSFGQCARGALDFVLSRLSLPDGSFASAEDATADEYAAYYAWTEAEIDSALGGDSRSFKTRHGVQPGGNVPASDDPSALYAQKNILRGVAESDAVDASMAARLLAVRRRRGSPPLDERATAGAYGLLLNTLCRAATQLGEPRYLEAAKRVLSVVKRDFLVAPDGTLRRLRGSDLPAGPDDYEALALGCRGYTLATNDNAGSALGERFQEQADRRFYGSSVGAFYAAAAPAGPGFFIRPLPAGDPPSPDTLAVLARSPRAKAIAASLSESLDESSAQAPGDQLLALALFAKRESAK